MRTTASDPTFTREPASTAIRRAEPPMVESGPRTVGVPPSVMRFLRSKGSEIRSPPSPKRHTPGSSTDRLPTTAPGTGEAAGQPAVLTNPGTGRHLDTAELGTGTHHRSVPDNRIGHGGTGTDTDAGAEGGRRPGAVGRVHAREDGPLPHDRCSRNDAPRTHRRTGAQAAALGDSRTPADMNVLVENGTGTDGRVRADGATRPDDDTGTDVGGGVEYSGGVNPGRSSGRRIHGE